MDYRQTGKNTLLFFEDSFSPVLTCDCGQAFRWKAEDENTVSGVAKKKFLRLKKEEDRFIFENTSKEEFESVWAPYFDLYTDYDAITGKYDEENLKKAVAAFPGIRILRQDSWEALCSFIISQNNNIPRIKGIIERFCALCGDRIDGEHFSFPTAEKTASLSVEDLAPVRAGFRAKYMIAAAKAVTEKTVDFEKIKNCDISAGSEELQKITGVGPKVAACTLLYGFGKHDAFPVDVWVKRVMAEMYPDGLPECAKGTEGIAQQYLFYYIRCLESDRK